jgi:hypothetical protein
MRKIKMLVSDERLGFKAGEVYEVEVYAFDHDKLSAVRRVPDGKDGEFNVYRGSRGEEWEYAEDSK